MNRYQINKLYIALFLLVGIHTASAQEGGNITPAALELLNQNSFWKKSNNAAGLQFDKPFEYSQLSAGYQRYGGNFRRPQQGTSGNGQTIATEGNLFVKDYFLTGSFSYLRDNIKSAEYNASIINPYRGMPFFIADLNPSDWNNQHYNLSFSMATPKFNDQWSFGLQGNYKASSGAKQRDIRAENTYFELSVKPSVVYSPSKRQHIGLNLFYGSVKEESGNSNVNNNVSQTYYDLMGLGTAVSYVGSGRTSNYVGDALGAGIQYHFEGNVQFFVSADYSVEAEKLQSSFTTPRDVTSVTRKIWNGKLSLKTGTDLVHFVDFNYYNRNIDGIQYITQRDNSSTQQGWITLFKNIRSTYSSQNAGVQYSLIAKEGKGNEYSWKLNAGVAYEKLKDEYILPNSIKQVENALITLNGKKNFILSDKKTKRLLIGAELGYNTNLSGRYQYNGANPDYPTVTGLEQNDFNYLSADYISAALPVVYSQQLKADSKNTLFVKGSVQYIHTKSFSYKERYYTGLSAGVNF
uniref:DUF6850 family outer membrane beta-barrel protein n=1 Tax=Pedobacter schmidteae TaxID=2201271 RepID=UPI000EAEE0D5|nr:DUF6850 family outer membrane beta-barrel protein [Pedobacter schmidteae]